MEVFEYLHVYRQSLIFSYILAGPTAWSLVLDPLTVYTSTTIYISPYQHHTAYTLTVLPVAFFQDTFRSCNFAQQLYI